MAFDLALCRNIYIFQKFMILECAMREFSTVELTQQIGTVTHIASKEPVMITHHRKPRFVLMSVEDFERMQAQGRPRRVYGVGETPPELAEMLAAELERRVNAGTTDHDDRTR
ncbi:type II toxin-antitoxin system prevent-host-death family antitoxin [Labrys wisconsinensis]|uniref:Antitoxin n=1 Tax=Labrys wisconsinensis TaxID=425677 RepID=A0ABU0J3S3_9HYPH|nr:type II toxin-antitoxin system prevent-host-death family antitoxin [Labrys wisconsinensis]MDQ0467954.1 PHD/YefM family antitoxin component YafN of YafNO toxin-antitoxin module [Labrys wisconsinensis]